MAACGGGSGNNVGNPPPPPPPPPMLIEGIFSDSPVEGLGFRVDGVDDGFTDAEGVFKYMDGRPVEFFIGDATNHIVVGSTTLSSPPSGTLTITPRDLFEVGGDDCSDNFVGNISRFLQTLDSDRVHRNGLTLDEAAIAAVTGTAAGRIETDFCLPGDEFAADPIIEAVVAELGRALVSFDVGFANFTTNFKQSRSSTLALTSDDRKLVVVNRQNDSVSVIEVQDDSGSDTSTFLAEVTFDVGDEPRFVAITPDDTRALITSAVSGLLHVIDLTAGSPAELGAPIDVGTEPRGVAISPNGRYAFIANHTVGEVTIVRLENLEIAGTVQTGGNPQSIAITNDGDDDDRDERVFVTRLFADLIDSARPDGFDDAKQGIVDSFLVGPAIDGSPDVQQYSLAAMASGFTADRRQFCLETRRALDANGEVVFFNSGENQALPGEESLKNDTFCPDVNDADASDDGTLAKTPQMVYPNMLYAALVRGPLLYVPNVGAQPEPPVKFNTNVQGLVSALSFASDGGSELSVNLNDQIKTESQPDNPTESLDRLFMNDVVAIDADKLGNDFLIVSRGGNFVIRASIDAQEQISIGAPDDVVRFQTGNLPSGIIVSDDGSRAYTNNELSTSVTVIDLINSAVLDRDLQSSEPPEVGTVAHRRLLGKLAFFTALGIPDVLNTDGNDGFDIPLRDVVPLEHRGKASDNGWSSCASCHEDGHSDNVTWIFPTGPRQTIPLEGTFARFDLSDQRILNWNAVRGSVTDFNNNARGVQGGDGFATDVNGVNRTGEVFNHGPTIGISDALDALTEWVATVRAPIAPDNEVALLGRPVFEEYCASCHGGAKWTKSRTSPVYANNPTFAENPIGINFFQGVKPLDSTVGAGGPQIISADLGRLRFLNNVGTFDPDGPIEIRGAGAIAAQSTQGFPALTAQELARPEPGLAPVLVPGALNAPSLLGLSYSAPYFHDGSAASLEEVLARHKLDVEGNQFFVPIDSALPELELSVLKEFLLGIDDDVAPLDSDTDRFLKSLQ